MRRSLPLLLAIVAGICLTFPVLAFAAVELHLPDHGWLTPS